MMQYRKFLENSYMRNSRVENEELTATTCGCCIGTGVELLEGEEETSNCNIM